jgi:hypothetical protein
MKGKMLMEIGLVLLVVMAAGIVVTYVLPAVSAGRGANGSPSWTAGLTDQQIAEIRQKIWELRAQAVRENWTTEQLTTAIHDLLAQYGITPQGAYFTDANGDGICDYLGQGRGPMGGQGRGQMGGQHRGNYTNYANCTYCPYQ